MNTECVCHVPDIYTFQGVTLPSDHTRCGHTTSCSVMFPTGNCILYIIDYPALISHTVAFHHVQHSTPEVGENLSSRIWTRMVHANVDHISGITKSSPYLFLSLFLIIWNIIFTIVGVQENEGDPLADEVVTKKKIWYGISLSFFPIFCCLILCLKCFFFLRCTKISRHQCRKLAETLLFDFVFTFMGTLYLAGDNLSILICSGMNSTTDKDLCIGQSSVIVGVSLLLHTALYVAGQLKLKPTDIIAFPVTGRIRKAYQTILQLVALTIILDQTFSTMVRLITHIDIEIDERPNCGSTQMEVEGFLAGLFIIMLPVILGLLVMKNWKDYCSCCWIKRKSMIRQCCCHLWENILIFVLYLLVIGFMIMYTLADNRWLWVCTHAAKGYPARLVMLCFLLLLSFFWIGMYSLVICLPRIGIIWKKKFSTENDYITVLAKKEEHKWVRENATVKRKGNVAMDRTNSIRDMAIEEDYGFVSIALPIEDITWWQGVCYSCQGRLECCPCCCKCTQWLTDFICRIVKYCATRKCSHVKDTTCLSCLQKKRQCFCKWLKKNLCKKGGNVTAEVGGDSNTATTCRRWLKKCMCKCLDSEEDELIMLTYLGKKEYVTTVTLSDDLTLNMKGYSPGTQFYVVVKEPPSQGTHSSNTESPSTESECKEPYVEIQ